jgi:hypothetical protein
MFVAEAEITVDASPEAAFDRLADYASWPEWMPASFRALDREPAKLAPGARVKVRIAHGAPATLEVAVVDRPRELTWRGGVPGLHAEHRFLFEEIPGSDKARTRVRSVETWRGVLAPALRPLVKRVAQRIGREQIAALAAALSRA